MFTLIYLVCTQRTKKNREKFISFLFLACFFLSLFNNIIHEWWWWWALKQIFSFFFEFLFKCIISTPTITTTLLPSLLQRIKLIIMMNSVFIIEKWFDGGRKQERERDFLFLGLFAGGGKKAADHANIMMMMMSLFDSFFFCWYFNVFFSKIEVYRHLVQWFHWWVVVF